MKNSIRNPFLFVWFILLLGVATMVAIPRVSLADEAQPFSPESETVDQWQKHEDVGVFAVLENLETGVKNILDLQVVEYSRISSEENEENVSVTFEVGIPQDMLRVPNGIFPEQASSSSDVIASEQKYLCDATSSVCATLTFNYHEGQTNGVDWMYSTNVTNRWTRHDPQVTWSNGELRARCDAWWLDKPGACSTTTVGYVSNPISGSMYTMVPSFAGFNNKTWVNDIHYQVASQQITLHRGGSNWNFYICIVNGGGSVIYGCY